MLVLGWFLVVTMRYVHEKNMFYVGTVQASCTLARGASKIWQNFREWVELTAVGNPDPPVL